MKKILFIGLPLLILIVGGGLFYKFKIADKKKNGAATTVEVKKGKIVEKALATGKIAPKHEIAVKSQVSGIVEKVYAEVGDKVQKGAPLFEIRPEPTPMEFAEAKRNAEIAGIERMAVEKELERARESKTKKVISYQAYDDVEMRYQEAVLRESLAKDRLVLLGDGKAQIADRKVETVIRSPIDGYVLERLANAGDPVVPLTSYQAGTNLMTLADMEDLLFKGTVDEIDVGKLQGGMPAEIRIGAMPDTTIPGRLIRISPKSRQVDNATVFDVEITLAPKDGKKLRAGYSANADIILRKKEDILTIPERVIEFKEEKAYVKLPGERPEQPPVEREITTGLSDGINIEVVSGLKEGEKVLEKPPKEIK